MGVVRSSEAVLVGIMPAKVIILVWVLSVTSVMSYCHGLLSVRGGNGQASFPKIFVFVGGCKR